MTREQVRKAIEDNLKTAGISIEDLRLQPAPGGGWEVEVVSSGFSGMPAEERRRHIGLDVGDVNFRSIEAITPAEKEWSGPLLLDSDLENLPLWPEALERGALSRLDIAFPSDLDEDIEPPVVATFYSLRGGVGRSTALGYTGKILAARGRKVVCVDMDLEAPGLAELFGRGGDVEEGMGLVHLLVDIDNGEDPDFANHLLKVSETDDLYCLPAGSPNAEYAHLLRFIEPSAWYREERNPLRVFMDRLKSGLPFKPDVILLDSRTGITSLSGPLLFDLSDLAVIVFFPHPQARRGTEALVRALLASKTWRTLAGKRLTPEPRFIVSPVPSTKIPEVVRRYEHRSLEWISEWISPVGRNGGGNGEAVETDITHFVPYREVIATSDYILGEREVWRDFFVVADWVDRFLRVPGEAAQAISVASQKDRILEELRFSAGTAEQQASLRDTFVETDLIKKALSPGIPLVLGRKGTGKTAIFRRLAEGEAGSIVVSAPAPLRNERTWLLGAEGFKGVSEILEITRADWRQFWAIYTSLACYFGWPFEGELRPDPEEEWREVVASVAGSELQMVKLLEHLMGSKSFGLLANDWIDRLDAAAPPGTLLLFDGLDTGFGSSDEDRKRRSSALEGLFSFVTDRADGLRNMRVKILLREDIWRHLRFENKSHFFGRAVALKWADLAGFFKVVIKQAVRSPGFRELLERSPNSASVKDPVDVWGEKEVYAAWNVLIGERMKGGKTTFTRNWVWNRLGDANEDHSPRYLLQLMHQVTEWERREHPRNPYDRSVVRPRGLEEVLPDVSEQALGALRDEEFPELHPLLENLREIGRTPMDASDLRVSQDLTNLGREVGLLGIYEGSEERVERYKVPELFRWALRMTRRGQK